MNNLRPLSDLTESLQTLAKSKHGDSLFTGSEFMDSYAQGRNKEEREEIAFAGGDLQNAYSNLYSVYTTAKNANEDNKNKFKVSGEAEQSLNTEAIAGKLGFVIEHLLSALARIREYDIPIASDVEEILEHVKAHKNRIETSGIVVVK